MFIIRYFILVVFLSFFDGFYSQIPSFKWAARLNNFSPLWNSPTDVKTDASGNVYAVGHFGGLNDFDPGPGVYNMSPNGTSGNTDIFIWKLDSLGNFIWAKHIGGSSSEMCGNVVLDAAGNIYLTGQFRQTVDFDPGPGTFTLSSSTWNVFILKLDMNGNFVYAKQVPGNAPSIALDVNNNVLVTGWFTNGGDFDPGTGIYNLFGSGTNGDAFILKLQNNGAFIWVKGIGGSFSVSGNIIKGDAQGNILVAGLFEGVSGFGSGANYLTSLGEKDIFFLKLNSAGNYQWAKCIGGLGYDRIRGIEVDAANNLFATGFFSASCDMDPGPGIITFTAPNISTFILKLDSNGNHVWSKQLGDSVYSESYDLFLDQGGNVYTVGFFQGSGDFDPGPGTHILSSPSNAYNTFISKLDNAGNNLWVGGMGGSGSTQGIAITGNSYQNVYITGFFYGTADLNPGILVDTLSWVGWETNMFIAGYGKCMQPLSPTMSNPESNLKICSGGTTALAVAGTGTVNWYPSQYSNTIIGTGNNFSTSQLTVNTTFYVDDNTNCAQSVSRTALTVTVNPLPTINVSSSDTIICAGGSATLTATGANSYTWEPNSNSSFITVSPSLYLSFPYIYSVFGTDTNGCTNVGSVLVYTKFCLGVDRYEEVNGDLNMYPTPCDQTLNIETPHSACGRASEINITNAMGQVLKKEKLIFDGAIATIDTTDLPSGVYYISLNSCGSKVINKKIIILH